MPPPSDFAGVLADEIKDIRARRTALFPGQAPLPSDVLPDPGRYAEAHRLRALGLAFSGGGIRSATFNLGVLQGLAELGLLPFIDYLSTVSGGGYIGAWLHGMIRNKYQGDPVAAQDQIHPRRVPGEPDSDPISFLRKYSNYLAPQPGLFSPDFWTIGSVWIRNMSLNQPGHSAAVPDGGGTDGALQPAYCSRRMESSQKFELGRDLWVLALAVSVTVVAVNLRQIVFSQFTDLKPRVKLPDLSGRFMVGGATNYSILASYIFGAFRFDPHPVVSRRDGLFVLFTALQWLGGFRLCYRARHHGSSGWQYLIGIPLVCAAFTATLLWAVWKVTGTWDDPDVEWLRIAFGPPMILVVWMCGTTLQIGLMGSDFPDAAREWLARMGASVSIGMAGYIGLFVIAVFGPYWLAWITLAWAPAGIALTGGWIGSAIGGYLTGKSAKTSGQPNEKSDAPTRTMEKIAAVSPVIFLAGFLLFVSLGTHMLLRALGGAIVPQSNCVVPITRNIPDSLLWLEPVQREYWCFLHYSNHPLIYTIAGLLAICLALISVLPLRFNINEFSMHHFYKNRLVRCFLGAGRASNRTPNRLTGFDPFDDFPLATLVPSIDPERSYLGPYPIVNCALNLNTGSELAKMERRGASFIFTPRYCGFDPPHSREDLVVTARKNDLQRRWLPRHAGLRGAARPRHRHRHRHLRRRRQSEFRLSHLCAARLPAHHSQRAPRLVARQSAPR